MKRPLVAVVSCYTIGLLLGGAFQPPLTALLIVAFVVLVLALALEKFRPFLIWPLLALAGWINLASRIAIVSPDDLRTLIGNDAAIVTVQGTLTETPHLKIAGRDEQETEHSLAKVRVAEIRRDEIWQPAFGTIIVSTPNPLPETFFAGQPVEISGVIARPPPPLADGLFDDRDYLQTRGIYYQLKTESTNDWHLLRPPILLQPPLTDLLFELVETHARARPAGRRRAAAIALGDDARLADGVHRRHRRSISARRHDAPVCD
jgi:hypothetical protein